MTTQRIAEIAIAIAINETDSAITALSGMQKVEDMALVGFYVPAAIDSTTLTIKNSHDGSTAYTMYDEYGATIGSAIPIAASRFVALDPNKYCGIQNFQVVMGSTETAARSIKFLARYV